MGYFAFGIINQHPIFLGSAERADVVVDFTGYEGQTFILYNDSPAPVPAGASVFDHFTGNGNQMDVGSAPNTLPGYGPNTRTIMQIRVGAAAPQPDVTLAKLEAVFAKTANKRGVFEVSQDTIIVPQAAYNSAYNASFPTSAAEQYLQIGDTAKTFTPIGQTAPVTIPLEMKAMHDEMGRRVRRHVRPDERHARAGESEFQRPLVDPVPLRGTARRSGQGLDRADPDRLAGRRDADLEDLPQRRGHAPDPHASVPHADHQPG